MKNTDRYAALVRGYAERADWHVFTSPESAYMALPASDLRELAAVFPDAAEIMCELDDGEVAHLIATRDYGELDRIFMRAVCKYALPVFCHDVHRDAEDIRDWYESREEVLA